MIGNLWKDSDKFRYFLFVLYPESAPDNWRKIMKKSGFEFAVSPLHQPDPEDSDDDDDEETEVIGKPHHHVVFHTSGNSPWTVKRAREKLKALNLPANGHVEPAFHPRNAQRYLIHMDQPEKQQFPEGFKSIELFNNFPLDLTKNLSTEEKRIVRAKVFELIRTYSIVEYANLIDALYDGYGDFDMLDYACNHTIMFNAYLGSKRNQLKIKDDE